MLVEAGSEDEGWWISEERANREHAPFVCDANEDKGERSGRDRRVRSPPARIPAKFCQFCETGSTRREDTHR